MSQCEYARNLGQIIEKGQKVNLDASSRAVAEQLRGLGYNCGKSSVGDHLAGRCACSKKPTGAAKIDPSINGLKILTLDIENKPNIVHTWGLFNQNIGLAQIIEPAGTFGVALKWYGEPAQFYSDHKHGHHEMLQLVHDAMNEADLIIGFNHIGFDLPHLNREFAVNGFAEPKPSGQVDLLRVVKKKFRMTSNKLDHVSEYFGLGNKTEHEGHKLWVRCMEGDPEAWELMETYAKHDVELTEALYDRVRGFIPNHPHVGMWTGDEWCCSNCGHRDLSTNKQGEAHTNVQRYRAYQCPSCGAWMRGTVRLQNPVKTRVYRR